MNHAYQGRIPPVKLSAMTAQKSSHNPHYYDGSSSQSPWYLDSGATNHITNAVDNLSFTRPYSGHDQVTVGNGEGLPITHIGSSYGEDCLPRFHQ
ncbi:hypothetical protein ACHQM5_009293 [Ranunculus cassubicifolius]